MRWIDNGIGLKIFKKWGNGKRIGSGERKRNGYIKDEMIDISIVNWIEDWYGGDEIIIDIVIIGKFEM